MPQHTDTTNETTQERILRLGRTQGKQLIDEQPIDEQPIDEQPIDEQPIEQIDAGAPETTQERILRLGRTQQDKPQIDDPKVGSEDNRFVSEITADSSEERIRILREEAEEEQGNDIVYDANNPALFLGGDFYDAHTYRGARIYPDAEYRLKPYRVDQIKETMEGYEPARAQRELELKEDAADKLINIQERLTNQRERLQRHLDKTGREDQPTQDRIARLEKELVKTQSIIDDDRIELWENVSLFDESPEALYVLSTNREFLEDFIPYVERRFGKKEALSKNETLEEFVGRAIGLWRSDLNRTIDVFNLSDHLMNDASGEQKTRFFNLYNHIEMGDEVPTIFERGRGDFIKGTGSYLWNVASDPLTWITGGAGAVVGVVLKRLALKYGVRHAMKWLMTHSTTPATIAFSGGMEANIDYGIQKAEQQAIDPVRGQTGIHPTVDPNSGELIPQAYDPGRTAMIAGFAGIAEGTMASLLIARGLGKIKSVPVLGSTNRKLHDTLNTREQAEVELQLARTEAEDASEDIINGQDYSNKRVRAILDGVLDDDGGTLQAEVKVEIAQKMDAFTRQIIRVYNEDDSLPDINTIIDLEVKTSDVVLQVTKKLLQTPDDFSDSAISRALSGTGLTAVEFVEMIGRDLGEDIPTARRITATDAARQLQSLSVTARLLNKMKNVDPAVDKKINEIFGVEPKEMGALMRLYNLARRANDETRGLMTSMPATFVRNMYSGFMLVTAGSVANLLESTLYHMGKGVQSAAKGEVSARGIQDGLANITRDTFTPLTLLFDPALSRDLANLSLRDTPNLNRIISRTLQETGERDLSKYTRYSNALNLAGDVLIRRALLNANIDRELRRGGSSFEELIASGKSVPIGTLERSVELALRGTMAYMPKNKGLRYAPGETVAHHFVKLMDASIVGAVILPFAKFMAGAMAMQIRYSPASYVQVFSNLAHHGINRARGKGPLTPAKLTAMRKQAAEGTVGTAALTAAVYYRANNQDSEWNMMGDTDIRNIWPIGFYMLVADAIVKVDQGTITNLEGKDYLEGIAGYGGRAGQAGFEIFDGMYNLAHSVISQKHEGGAEWTRTIGGEDAGAELGRILAEWVNRTLTQGRIVSDVQRAYDHEAAIIKDKRQYTGTGFWERGLSGFGETMQANLPDVGLFDPPQPPRYVPTRTDPPRRTATLLKQLLGLTTRQPERDYERELFQLGLDDHVIYSNTGEGELDNAMRRQIGFYIENNIAERMGRDDFLAMPRLDRIATVKNWLAEFREIARQQVHGEFKELGQNNPVSRLKWKRLPGVARSLSNERNIREYGQTVEEAGNYMEGAEYGRAISQSKW